MPYECYIKFESTRSNLTYSGDSLLRADLLSSSNSVSTAGEETIAALLQLEIILTSDAVDKYYRYSVLPRNFSSPPLFPFLFSLFFFFSLIRTDILSLLGFVFLFFFLPSAHNTRRNSEIDAFSA